MQHLQKTGGRPPMVISGEFPGQSVDIEFLIPTIMNQAAEE
jgi:hypothetical protein